MNTLAKAVLVSAVISLPALSGNAYSHAKTDSTGGMMMDPQQMMDMHEKMQKNHALMEQIRLEEDAGKRTDMMQQHMKSMHEQMQMMGNMMGGEHRGKMPAEAMPDQIEMMKKRMDMMQMMMQQMMDHQEQDQKLDEHHDN